MDNYEKRCITCFFFFLIEGIEYWTLCGFLLMDCLFFLKTGSLIKVTIKTKKTLLFSMSIHVAKLFMIEKWLISEQKRLLFFYLHLLPEAGTRRKLWSTPGENAWRECPEKAVDVMDWIMATNGRVHPPRTCDRPASSRTNPQKDLPRKVLMENPMNKHGVHVNNYYVFHAY